MFLNCIHSYTVAMLNMIKNNDIASPKSNTAAPWSHRGTLEHNLEPDNIHHYWLRIHLFHMQVYANAILSAAIISTVCSLVLMTVFMAQDQHNTWGCRGCVGNWGCWLDLRANQKAVTTSGTAVLPDETKLLVGEILKVILTTINSKLVINEHCYSMMIT